MKGADEWPRLLPLLPVLRQRGNPLPATHRASCMPGDQLRLSIRAPSSTSRSDAHGTAPRSRRPGTPYNAFTTDALPSPRSGYCCARASTFRYCLQRVYYERTTEASGAMNGYQASLYVISLAWPGLEIGGVPLTRWGFSPRPCGENIIGATAPFLGITDRYDGLPT